MTNIILLFICFIIGILLRLVPTLPENTPRALNFYIIYVALPATTVLFVKNITFEPSLIIAILAEWMLVFMAIGLFNIIGKKAGFSKAIIGCLIITTGLGNTSFIGFPMIEAFYGKKLMGIGIMYNQLGTFLVLSTVGILIATRYSGFEFNKSRMLKKIFTFPPLLSLIAGLALIPVKYPDMVKVILKRLSGTLAPIALISVGMMINFKSMRKNLAKISIGVVYKLILGPAVLLTIFAFIFGVRGSVLQITIFEAAMAPMITGGIIAEMYGLDPELASGILGVGIPLSFATLFLWFEILKYFV